MAKLQKSPKTDSPRRNLAETQDGIFGEKEQKKIERREAENRQNAAC